MWKFIILLGWMIILSIFDIKTRKVPIAIMAAGSIAAAVQVAVSLLEREVYMGEYFMAWLPGAFFLAAAYSTGKVGYADGWLLWVVGSVLTYRQCLLSFFVSLCLISIFSILLLVIHKANRRTQLPYIPFLTIAIGIQAIYLTLGG